MKEIRQIIYEDYPFCKTSFLPTFYVYNVKKDLDLTNKFIGIIKQSRIIRPNLNRIERYIRFACHSELNGPIMFSLDIGDLDLYNALTTGLDRIMVSRMLFPLINMSRDDIKINMLEQKNHKKIKLILYLRAKKHNIKGI